MTALNGPKVKTLNKETVTFVLMEQLNLPDAVIGAIVELVWRSDELLENYQLNFVEKENKNEKELA